MIAGAPPMHKESADWRPLKMWLSVERRKLFKQLASVVPADEAQHNITRGRIAQIDDLIRAVEPERLLEAAEPPDYFDD